MVFRQTKKTHIKEKMCSLHVIAFIEVSARTSIAGGFVFLKAVASFTLAATSVRLGQKGRPDEHRQVGIMGKQSRRRHPMYQSYVIHKAETREGKEVAARSAWITWLAV